MAGMLGETIVLGLPGNPVSAFVTALLFARPLIAALAGAAVPITPPQHAILAQPLAANGPRTQYLRGYWSEGTAAPLADQDSGALTPLARTELLIVRDAHAPSAARDDLMEIIPVA